MRIQTYALIYNQIREYNCNCIQFILSYIYKRFFALIKVCRGTKQQRRHRDTRLTIIFFTETNTINEHWTISLFCRKAKKHIEIECCSGKEICSSLKLESD